MVSIIGLMEAFIREILSKGFGMGTVFGKIKNNNTKEVIVWIKNKDLEYTNGNTNKFSKDRLEMIIDRDMDNSLA